METLLVELKEVTRKHAEAWEKGTPAEFHALYKKQNELLEQVRELEAEWCEEHEQAKWKDGLKCGGCLEDEEDEEECNQCNAVLDDSTGREWIAELGCLCARCYELRKDDFPTEE